jgi:integrase/recombinase XerD
VPKINRNGQALVLTDEQLGLLFEHLNEPHRLLFQICYFTAARVGEAIQLQSTDICGDRIVYRASITKTRQTRDVVIVPPLAAILSQSLPKGYLFSSGTGHLSTQSADKALRKVCDRLGLKGVSTHSFRRSLLTKMYRAGHSLKTIQQITKHQDLGNLAKYLEVGQEEADQALRSLWD